MPSCAAPIAAQRGQTSGRVVDGAGTVHTVVVRIAVIDAVSCALGAGIAGCGGEGTIEPTDTLPSSGSAYRALDLAHRSAVAAGCRDQVAARASGQAARQLRAVDPAKLHAELDDMFTLLAAQRRAVAEVCPEVVPFVTPGLGVSFDGAKDQRDGRSPMRPPPTSG
jgi:hypothetical protein